LEISLTDVAVGQRRAHAQLLPNGWCFFELGAWYEKGKQLCCKCSLRFYMFRRCLRVSGGGRFDHHLHL